MAAYIVPLIGGAASDSELTISMLRTPLLAVNAVYFMLVDSEIQRGLS